MLAYASVVYYVIEHVTEHVSICKCSLEHVIEHVSICKCCLLCYRTCYRKF